MWQSFLEWIGAGWKGTVALVIGGLSAVMGVAQQLGIIRPDFLAPLWVWIVVAAVGLVGGPFFGFHRMRKERDAIRHELTALRERAPEPLLTGEILQIIVGVDEETKATGISLAVEVRNIGSMPSVIRRWEIAIQLVDDRLLQPPLMHWDQIQFGRIGGLKGPTYTKANLIYEKTATLPVAIGAAQAGILVARTSDANPTDILRKGVVVRVSFQDVLNRSYTIQHVSTGPSSEQKYYPGI